VSTIARLTIDEYDRMIEPRFRMSSCVRGLLFLAFVFQAGCGGQEKYPNRPITLVCPWAAGGGTDRVSREMAAFLEADLGVPVNVINATGGKGVTGHNRGLQARPDGYTITMITLELNMLHWSGLTELAYDDCTPLMSINEDYAALLVRGDAPWQTLADLEADVRRHPRKLKASGTASGGAWHLGLAGWLVADGLKADDVTWISSTGAGPSLQELVSGGIDMVVCSLPEASTLYKAGHVRALGVMSHERVKGYPEVPTFIEQGNDWTLGGWRGLAAPKGTPPHVVDVLVRAIERVVTGETKVAGRTFPEFMEIEGFNNPWRGPVEFRQFLAETDDKFGKLLTSDAMRSVNVDRFSPMVFPNLLLTLMGLTLAALLVQRFVKPRQPAPEAGEIPRPDRRGIANFAMIVLAVVLYLLLAETVGFVLLVGALMFALCCRLGTRVWVSAIVAVVFVPVVYQLFANLLRVPLPRGWLGW
jgi:tripartite-type tricarboxylate transporter receptor subunit TctC